MSLGTFRLAILLLAPVSVTLDVPAVADKAGGAGALAEDTLSDDAILLQMIASREYCKTSDPAHAADYDKAFEALTPADDDKAALRAFLAKPDSAAAIARRAVEIDARDKASETAGAGKEMCSNYRVTSGLVLTPPGR